MDNDQLNPNDREKPRSHSRLVRLAWLPIPAFIVMMAVLWVANPRGAYESPSLLLVLNFVFSMLASCFVVYLVGRSFLARRAPGVLLLGCGVIAWGAAGLVGVTIGILEGTGGELDINSFITIHNLCVWLSALCHLAGVGLSFWPRRELRAAGLWLTAAYALALGAVGIVTLSALAHWTPIFFVQGQGGTPTRFFVLGSASIMFVLSAVLLGTLNRRPLSPFVYWYTLALALIAVGLFGIMIETIHANLLSWTGRAAQFLSGAYMLIAAFASRRESRGREIALAPAEEAWRENALLVGLRQQTPLGWVLRYGLAAVAVAAAMGVQQTLTAWVGGALPPYTTFYPMVMVVAMLCGLGPGLLATALTGFAVAYWVLPPVGQLAIASSGDRLGLVFFSAMGLFMSAVAELSRRYRHKAAAYDRGAALRESQARLAIFAEVTFEGIIESEAGRIVNCNEQFARMLGYSVAELNGVEIASFVAPEDRDRVMAIIRQGRESSLEHTSLRKDGTRIIVEVHGRPVSPGSTRRLTAIRDITERKQSEERYRLLFQNLQEGFYLAEPVLDDSGKCCDALYLDVNPAFERIMGRPRDQIIGKRATELVPGLKPEWLEVFGKVTRTGEPASHQAYSDYFQQYFEAFVFRPAPGRFGVLVADITERKRTEDALRQSEERYRGMFTTMLEGFCIIEVLFDADNRPTDYRFLEINPMFEAQTGLRNAQGKRMRELAPDHEAHWFEIYGKVALTGKPARFVNEAKALNRWFDVSAYRVGGPDSRKVAILFSDITDRKQAEVALQTTLQRFYAVLSSMYSGVLLVTDKGRVEFANQAICDQLGLKDAPNDLIGLASSDMLEKIKNAYLHPDEAAARIREIVDRGQPVKGEEIAMRGGRTCLRDFVPLNAQGKSYSRMWLHMDITEVKQAEEALRQSERQFRALADSIPNLAWWANADGYITWYNQRWYEYTGTTPKQMEGWGWQSVHDPQMLPSVLERWKASIAAGAPFDMTFPLRGADGVFRLFLTRAIPLKDAQDRVQQWFGTNTDVSEQAKAAEILARLAAIVESSDDAILSKNLDGTITSWNAGAARLLGYRPDEIVGRPIHLLLPPDRQEEEAQIMARLEAGERLDHFETVRLAKDGRSLEVSVTISPLKDAAGRIIGASKILHDITERKRVEAELQRRAEELQAANRELTRFNQATVGRELRMVELKKEINDLCAQAGQDPRYATDLENEVDLPS